MKKRKAETLVEFLMASFIFVEIMTGVINFIANQTETLVNIRNRDTMMFHAQRFINMQPKDDDDYNNNDKVCKADNVKVFSEDNILKVSKGKSTITINLNP